MAEVFNGTKNFSLYIHKSDKENDQKVRFPAVSAPEYSVIGSPVYTNAPRKNRIGRKGVELLKDTNRNTLTTAIADLHDTNILIMDTIDIQNRQLQQLITQKFNYIPSMEEGEVVVSSVVSWYTLP